MKKDVEGCGNCTIEGEFLQSLGETEGNHGKISLEMVDVPTESRITHFPNTYLLTELSPS
jgi:hypothetical protein